MEKRLRSPNYPAISLKEALARVSALYKAIHTHAAPREVVAKGIGYNALHGASATAISALQKYGLLERAGEDLRISDRAMQILHPQSPEEKAQAVRAAATAPALFAELAERFPGSMPNEELLRNYLLRNGFAPGAVSAVILAYRETSELVAQEVQSYPHAPSMPTMEQHAMQPPQGQPSQPRTLGELAAPNLLRSQGDQQVVLMYQFSQFAAPLVVAAPSGLPIEEALEMVETQIAIKRKELARNAKRAAASAKASEGEPDGGQNA